MNPMMTAAAPVSRNSRAFTLIEMLVVVAIIAILLSLVVPAVVTLMQSSNLNKSAQLLTDELNFARQIALSQNRNVEVRFYKLPSPTNSQDLQFRAFRSLAAIGTSTTESPLSTVRYLPAPIIISTATDSVTNIMVSTLLNAGNPNLSGLMTGTENLPVSGTTPYISFFFRATEGTNLAPITGTNSNWYLTLYSETAANITATGIPANYFTAQVDPVTGRVLTYRP